MIFDRTRTAIWLLASSLLLTGLVHAEPTAGWYSRVAVNRTVIDFETQAGDVLTFADSSETGFNVGFGYRFTPNFGLEVSYADLGKHLISQSCTAEACAALVQDFDIDPKVFSLLGTAALPFTDQFSAFVLLGAANIDAEIDDTTELSAGLGAAFQASTELAFDLRFSRLVFDSTDDFDVFEFGVIYSF